MKRYHILRDSTVIGSAPTREDALDLIHAKMLRETHPFLKASFSIIYGEEECIPYPKQPR